ncbi:hypothetical protein OP10G_3654 [Fimbriimonas ginsengisoli Gsoil 348]|uniref:Uncharacterized protein n=1 Tax=Fimbriimonas ginsengisoli Gsoil 348 TaxID=661478 RepID=A0A068NUJ6_FIMGI|nr:hypothetical protein OP10G_3654 [Fimbriimonas ginsengisoli Gsoil 348]
MIHPPEGSTRGEQVNRALHSVQPDDNPQFKSEALVYLRSRVVNHNRGSGSSNSIRDIRLPEGCVSLPVEEPHLNVGDRNYFRPRSALTKEYSVVTDQNRQTFLVVHGLDLNRGFEGWIFTIGRSYCLYYRGTGSPFPYKGDRSRWINHLVDGMGGSVWKVVPLECPAMSDLSNEPVLPIKVLGAFFGADPARDVHFVSFDGKKGIVIEVPGDIKPSDFGAEELTATFPEEVLRRFLKP